MVSGKKEETEMTRFAPEKQAADTRFNVQAEAQKRKMDRAVEKHDLVRKGITEEA